MSPSYVCLIALLTYRADLNVEEMHNLLVVQIVTL